MGFDRGTLSYRYFLLPRDLPENALSLFAEHAAPPVLNNHGTDLKGWVTSRHLMDRDIQEHTAYVGSYLHLVLLLAERKIPTSLLNAECRIEELAELAASGRERLSRKERKEIKDQVTDRLLPTMPPQLKGLPFVHLPQPGLLAVGAMSDKQIETFAMFWQYTFGFQIDPAEPQSAILQRKHLDPETWAPTSFSPRIPDAEADPHPGRDFLTWLWFLAETQNGTAELPDGASVEFMIEGPLSFYREGDGAHEIILRRGNPLRSAEAQTALLTGKKLRQARFSFVQDELVWQTTVDADTFGFRSLKLPEDEALDAIGRFQERMGFIEQWYQLFYGLLDRFVEVRATPETWSPVRQAIHAWTEGRKGRA